MPIAGRCSHGFLLGAALCPLPNCPGSERVRATRALTPSGRTRRPRIDHAPIKAALRATPGATNVALASQLGVSLSTVRTIRAALGIAPTRSLPSRVR